MNEQDYELLSRYVDGELDNLAAERLNKRLAAEPDLQATLNRFSELDSELRQAFSGSDTVPENIVAMVRPNTGKVLPFARRQQRPTWQYAIAASLVAAAGLVLAPQWQDSTASSPTLASILESTPSMATGWMSIADGSEVRPVLSFRSVDGNWCREYLSASDNTGKRGVACRENGQWEVRVAAATALPGSDSDFRPAGANDADLVADYLADKAEGIALSADEEQALIAADWQR